MSERTSLAPEIDVDGIDTPKGATLIGKATLNKELGKYVCLANVGGALCVVELNIPVDTAPAAPAPADTDAIMALAEDCRKSYGWELRKKRAALRSAVERVARERDELKSRLEVENAESMRQYNEMGLRIDLERAQRVIDQAARLMHGEGVEDQAEAWDKALRLLDAAREGK